MYIKFFKGTTKRVQRGVSLQPKYACVHTITNKAKPKTYNRNTTEDRSTKYFNQKNKGQFVP